MSQHIIVRDVVGAVPYWAGDETLPQVRARFKRLTGRFPSKKASILAFEGDLDLIDKITINDLGDILYSKDLTTIKIQ